MGRAQPRSPKLLITYDAYGSNGSLALASVTGMPGHDDTNYGTGNTVRGNPTFIQRLTGGTPTYLNSVLSYDTTGQTIETLDSNSNKTDFSYSATYKNAFVTTITNALLQTTSFAYDFSTGLLTSVTDANSQPTYYHLRQYVSTRPDEFP